MGIKPGSAKGFSGGSTLTPVAIGCCTQCKTYIYPWQGYARVARPTIGWNHADCVPEDATVVEEVAAK